MKPRIFINMHYMEIGGAERALLGLLNAIDTNKVDVDLFINQHTGEFMKLIPEKINLLPEIPTYSVIESPIKDAIRKGQLKIAFARLKARLKYNKYLKSLDKPKLAFEGSATHYVADEVIKHLPSLYHLGEYDLAISFLDPPHIVQDKVLAKKKIEWIHTDFSYITVNYDVEFPRWNKNDYIASISPDITKAFIKTFPSLENKIVEIENILSPTFIQQQSKLFSPIEMDGNFIKICSIGRFCYQKNFESIPFIAKTLKDKGIDFKWYIIGFGDTAETVQNINITKTEDCVILLGKKENPYPYIANCDIYVQPSRYEGKSVTVREAQILCKPVIITNYPTSSSQITNNVDGIICDIDNEAIANAIYNLTQDNELQSKIIDYLSTRDYGNEKELDKIYTLLGI